MPGGQCGRRRPAHRSTAPAGLACSTPPRPQAEVYARAYPELLNQIQQEAPGAGAALPSAATLARRFNSLLKPALGTGRAQALLLGDGAGESRVRALVESGRLEELDPACAEVPVLDWPREERRRQRHEQRRRQELVRRRVQHETAQGSSTYDPDADYDFSDDADGAYRLHEGLLRSWEAATRVGRWPLPRKAPSAVLTCAAQRGGGHSASPAPVPQSWLDSASTAVLAPRSRRGRPRQPVHSEQTVPGTAGRQAWKLPWVSFAPG